MSALQAVQALERAVEALATCDPGDLETLLPRVTQADFQLLNIRHSTRELCNAERQRRADRLHASAFKEPAHVYP